MPWVRILSFSSKASARKKGNIQFQAIFFLGNNWSSNNVDAAEAKPIMAGPFRINRNKFPSNFLMNIIKS